MIPIPSNPRFRNLTGQEFGRLVVLEYAGRSGHTHLWKCKCSCGKEKLIHGSALTCNLTRSCGCLLRETTVARSYRHGGSKVGEILPEYNIYLGLKDRCYNPNDHAYARYGGRGIKVCQEWLDSFSTFLEDVGSRPSAKHSIDRFPDLNGNYEPGNVRWATDLEQARNKRNNCLLTYQGETICVSEWAERTGLKATTLYMRIRRGWSVEKAISTPV